MGRISPQPPKVALSASGNHPKHWRERTRYASATDFVFLSFRRGGRAPLSASIFVADHLRPAAIAAGVSIQPSQRFGLHNLRHSLSTFLVNTAKVQAKTVQGILRHSRIQTTLDLYTQGDSDETRAAQGEFLRPSACRQEQCNEIVGWIVG